MARTRNEIELQAVRDEMGRKADEIRAIWKKSEDEERGSTPEETTEVERLYKHIQTVLEPRQAELEDAIKVEQDVRNKSRELGKTDRDNDGFEFHNDARAIPGGNPIDRMVKSIGEQFTESQQFKGVQENWKEGRTRFNTGMVSVMTKGTLLEGTAGSGAGLVSVPQVLGGITDTLFQRLTFADLLLSGQTNSTTVRHVVEGTATSGATGVAEGAAKPQSTLGLDVVDDPVKKIATTLIVSDEMLEDVAAVQSYINGRLILFVQIEEEDQLIRGAGTNDLYGIIDSSRGINTRGTTGDTDAFTTLFKAMNGQRGSSKLEPDWIVMHPDNWSALRLTKDSGTTGQYYGGGPFFGPYGGPQGPATGQGVTDGAQDALWGKPVYVTTAIGSGTALVGTRSAAQVFRRGGVSVEASNSGYVNTTDLFTSNLVAIRAEERLALCVFRPSAFTLVSGLGS